MLQQTYKADSISVVLPLDEIKASIEVVEAAHEIQEVELKEQTHKEQTELSFSVLGIQALIATLVDLGGLLFNAHQNGTAVKLSQPQYYALMMAYRTHIPETTDLIDAQAVLAKLHQVGINKNWIGTNSCVKLPFYLPNAKPQTEPILLTNQQDNHA